MSMHNVDDLLNRNLTNPEPTDASPEPVKAEETSSEPEKETKEPEKLSYLEQFKKDKEEILGKKEPEPAENDTKTEETSSKNPEKPEKPEKAQEVDEYGTEVPKAKVYTEEEVQAIVRKRLKLRHEEQQQQAQYQPPAQPQYQEPQAENSESDVPWEVQLEQHIEKTVGKLQQKEQQKAWQHEEQIRQAEFETRFTTGMDRYSDFKEVVANKPITNGIMLAARSMKDPAAFIYAASKQQPKELERISQITDPYQLAAEVGRLEERMKKAKTVSSAPKPSTKTKGDMGSTNTASRNLDDLIRMDAKRKLQRR